MPFPKEVLIIGYLAGDMGDGAETSIHAVPGDALVAAQDLLEATETIGPDDTWVPKIRKFKKNRIAQADRELRNFMEMAFEDLLNSLENRFAKTRRAAAWGLGEVLSTASARMSMMAVLSDNKAWSHMWEEGSIAFAPNTAKGKAACIDALIDAETNGMRNQLVTEIAIAFDEAKPKRKGKK